MISLLHTDAWVSLVSGGLCVFFNRIAAIQFPNPDTDSVVAEMLMFVLLPFTSICFFLMSNSNCVALFQIHVFFR